VFCTGTSTADPAVDADAPPAIAKDTPATPNAGAALFRLFRFEPFFAGAIRVLPYLIPLDAVTQRGQRSFKRLVIFTRIAEKADDFGEVRQR
jgi:hypothetical protein